MRFFSKIFLIMTLFHGLTSYGADAKAALDAAYAHEYAMSARYGVILSQFGEIRPFSNLFRAEERHQVLLMQQYARLGLTVPRLEESIVPTFNSVPEACAASLEAEYASVALYDTLLGTVVEPTLRDAFSYLRQASAERHIPALKRCGGWGYFFRREG